MYKGFIPLGCDGTRQACPRSEELERRLGTFGKKDSSPASPMIWNTSIVHLALGIPWCWRFGRGTKASERLHLIQMISLLPRLALMVTDAGYVGYEVMRALVEAKVWFLIRMSSNATFYSEDQTPLAEWQEGIVYYWPEERREAGQPAPLFVKGVWPTDLREKSPAQSRRVAADQRGRSWAFVDGTGIAVVSLALGERRLLPNLQTHAQENQTPESHGAAGSPRGRSLDDCDAVVALPGSPGHAGSAWGRNAGDVQSSESPSGNSSRDTPPITAARFLCSPFVRQPRTPPADQSQRKTNMATPQETQTARRSGDPQDAGRT
jgi:hypothetical protein